MNEQIDPDDYDNNMNEEDYNELNQDKLNNLGLIPPPLPILPK